MVATRNQPAGAPAVPPADPVVPPVDPAVPPADPVVPPAPPAVPFALVPGAGVDVIDYSTRAGIALFSQATRSLYQDPSDLYNVDSAGLQTFLALIKHRGTTCGWDFGVPQDNADPLNNQLHLLDNHGRFSMDHLVAFSASFIHDQSRAAQMNMQIVKCILSSLSMPGFRKVQTWHSSWHHTQGTSTVPAYPLLIKVIIREAYIDTQATTRILRENLSSLPAKLEELKGDIDQLNAFVKVTQDQLAAQGETTTDLLANLFKGYLSSRDPTFRRYIEKKQEDYDDGATFTIEGLMNSASNKFKLLVESGKWMAPSDDQAKILALEAKVNKFGNKGKSSNSSGNGKSGSGKSSRRSGTKKETPAWMTKWPGKEFVDANKTKTMDGHVYYWCRVHKRFTRHQTSECNLAKAKANRANGNARGPSSPPSSPPNSPPFIHVDKIHTGIACVPVCGTTMAAPLWL
jgi:hypothetical protein